MTHSAIWHQPHIWHSPHICHWAGSLSRKGLGACLGLLGNMSKSLGYVAPEGRSKEEQGAGFPEGPLQRPFRNIMALVFCEVTPGFQVFVEEQTASGSLPAPS